MRVLLINEVFGTTSTGKICAQIAEQMEAEGNEVKVAYGRWANVPEKYQRFAHYIGSNLEVKLHAIQTRLFDTHGFGSRQATIKFLKWAEKYNPDLLWLHNLHGYYINIELLFEWIKKHPKMQVKWTLHDCWAFTGHCSHFTVAKCEQWKTRCSHCTQLRRYPACIALSSVSKNFERKRKACTGVKSMTLITPSKWLADLTRESFLKEYPVEVCYNTIDNNTFKPTFSNFREKYGLEGKYMILGVANVWDERKGLQDFCELYQRLGDRYAIVIVGLTKKQIKKLPSQIIGITRTSNPQELAGIYTTADIFFNPTYEDNYPTVNLEAEACGTRVISYNVGGAPETLKSEKSQLVPVGDIQKVVELIMNQQG